MRRLIERIIFWSFVPDKVLVEDPENLGYRLVKTTTRVPDRIPEWMMK